MFIIFNIYILSINFELLPTTRFRKKPLVLLCHIDEKIKQTYMSENFKINVILLKSGKSIESNEFKINLNIFQYIIAQIFGYTSMSVFHTNRHYLKHQTYVYGMFFFLNFLQIFYKYFNSTVMNTYNQFCIRISPLSNHKYKPLIVCTIFFSSNVILSNGDFESFGYIKRNQVNS